MLKYWVATNGFGVIFGSMLIENEDSVRVSHSGKEIIVFRRGFAGNLKISLDGGITLNPMINGPIGGLHYGWYGLSADAKTIVDTDGTIFYKSTNKTSFNSIDLSSSLFTGNLTGYSFRSGCVTVSKDGNHIAAAIYHPTGYFGLAYSHDSGNTWSATLTNTVYSNEDQQNLSRIFVSSNGSKIIYALGDAINNGRIYYSEDGGITLTNLPLNFYWNPQKHAIMSENGDIFYCSYRETRTSGSNYFYCYQDFFKNDPIKIDNDIVYGSNPIFDENGNFSASADGLVCYNINERYIAGYIYETLICRRRKIIPNLEFSYKAELSRKKLKSFYFYSPSVSYISDFAKPSSVIENIRVIVTEPASGYNTIPTIKIGDSLSDSKFVEIGDVDLTDSGSISDFIIQTKYKGHIEDVIVTIDWGGAISGSIDIIIDYY